MRWWRRAPRGRAPIWPLRRRCREHEYSTLSWVGVVARTAIMTVWCDGVFHFVPNSFSEWSESARTNQHDESHCTRCSLQFSWGDFAGWPEMRPEGESQRNWRPLCVDGCSR